MKIIVKMCLVVTVMAVTIATLGTGISAAKDPFVGQAYGDVAAKIADKGGTAIISTALGTALPLDQCVIASWRKLIPVKNDGFKHKRAYLFSVNCNAKLAHAGEPGNSLASPAGRKEKGIEDAADNLNSKPSRCSRDLKHCQIFCERYEGMCSADVMALLPS